MYHSDFDDPQFQKVFEFERNHEWMLPKTAFDAPHFEIPELQDMKRELNRVKSSLSEFNLTEWSFHTHNRDPAGYVINQLKQKIRPELLTQAWCKFYEVMSTFFLLKSHENNCVKSLHLCEAPGAFICALNHYLVLHYPDISWQWYANTLNPDYEGNSQSHMIADDRLINHTRDHWLFGLDLTGDLLKFYNHVGIVSKVTSDAKVDLVTADGSIDCMCDPGEQEKLVEFLHYCETITALAVLKTNGSFVLKIFTIFEDSTLCLLYLLNCVFNKTYLFKPCTSKSGNSELYFVCIGFNGFEKLSSIWETLTGPYKHGCFNRDLSMFSVDDIPNSFKVQVTMCCSDFFLENQIETINTNIYYFLNPQSDDKQYMHNRKVQIAKRFIRKYQLKSIAKGFRVVPYLDVHVKNSVYSFSNNSDCFNSEHVNISIGKRIDTVHTSKFASVKHIEHLMKFLDGENKHANIQRQSCLYNLVLGTLDKTVTVINGNMFRLSPYFKYQRDLFASIQSAVNNGKNIVFINVAFHTHFLAALYAILMASFEHVCNNSGWCLFYKPISTKIKCVKDVFSQIEQAYNSLNNVMFPSDVIYVFEPSLFCNELDFIPRTLSVYNNFQIP